MFISVSKGKVMEFLPVLLTSFVCGVFLIGFVFNRFSIGNYVLTSYIISLIAFYASFVFSIARYLVPSKKGGDLAALVLYVIMSAVLIGGFGVAWTYFQHFKAVNDWPTTKLDAFYFSVMSFTTIGFGDFVPSDRVGKMLVSVEALMGAHIQ